MKDTTEISQPSVATSAINYILNRFMPFLCVGGLLIYACGYDSLIPYAVLGFMWFTSSFSFACGFASATMDQELNSYRAKAIFFTEDSDDDESEEKEEE